MVPLAGVEEAIQTATGAAELRCVVTSLPDPARGERLVALYVGDDFDPAAVLAQLAQAGIPQLWMPRREAFHRIEAIPLLGTGKLDLKQVKELAAAAESKG